MVLKQDAMCAAGRPSWPQRPRVGQDVVPGRIRRLYRPADGPGVSGLSAQEGPPEAGSARLRMTVSSPRQLRTLPPSLHFGTAVQPGRCRISVCGLWQYTPTPIQKWSLKEGPVLWLCDSPPRGNCRAAMPSSCGLFTEERRDCGCRTPPGWADTFSPTAPACHCSAGPALPQSQRPDSGGRSTVCPPARRGRAP